MYSKLILLVMSLPLIGCFGADKAPKGSLVYCSYSSTGAAGLGKDYCELIAEPGETPKVVVALNVGNRFGTPEIHEEFPVEPAVVDSMQAGLKDLKVHKLNGYNLDEAITGGHAYRIHMEYSSGAKITARWYGHHVKEDAIAAYNWIERFFAPWRSAAIERNRAIISCSFVEKHPVSGTDALILSCKPYSRPTISVHRHIDNTQSKPEEHLQINLGSDTIVNEFKRDFIALQVKDMGDLAFEGDLEQEEAFYDLELEYEYSGTQRLIWTPGNETPALKALRERIARFISDAAADDR